MARSIVGQDHVVARLVIALLADGHVLVEGLPGLAKTRAEKSLASNLACGLLERARRSERARFGAFVRATRDGDAARILAALFAWLDRRSTADRTATIAGFVEESSSPGLRTQTDGLEASLFSREEPTRWSPAELRREAVEARRRAGQAGKQGSSGPLGPLNP